MDLAKARYGAHMPSAAELLPLPPGLVAVTGDEGAGKTGLLRRLCEHLAGLDRSAGCPALWLDPSLPGQDEQTPSQVWGALRQRCPLWDEPLQQELIEALGLQPHLGKSLFMLSTGSRRKVALVGLLASGAAVTCLDQPLSANFSPTLPTTRRGPGWLRITRRIRICPGGALWPWADRPGGALTNGSLPPRVSRASELDRSVGPCEAVLARTRACARDGSPLRAALRPQGCSTDGRSRLCSRAP
jgi:hypothetical protein